jgi:hypothetical protein
MAWWASFFAAYWLVLLKVIPADFASIGAIVFFFLGSCVINLSYYQPEVKKK